MGRLCWAVGLWVACFVQAGCCQRLLAEQLPQLYPAGSPELSPRLAREAADALEAAYMQSYGMLNEPDGDQACFRVEDMANRKGKSEYISGNYSPENNMVRANSMPKANEAQLKQPQVQQGRDSTQQSQLKMERKSIPPQSIEIEGSMKNKFLPDFARNAKFPPSFPPTTNFNQGGLGPAQPHSPILSVPQRKEEPAAHGTPAGNILPSYAYEEEVTTASDSRYQCNDDIADFREYLMKKVASEKEYLKFNRTSDTGVAPVGLNRAAIKEDFVPQERERGAAYQEPWHGVPSHIAKYSSNHVSRAVGRVMKNKLNKRVQAKDEHNAEDESGEDDSIETRDEDNRGDEDVQRQMGKDRFIKDKMVHLPEPIPYNESHYVSDIIYSMIPFRSPLLSLLESTRPAKYIMMKVNPILMAGDDHSFQAKHRHETPREIDTRIEQTLIELVDKSIGNEFASASNGDDLYGRQHITNKIKNKMLKIPEFGKIMHQEEGQKTYSNPVSATGQELPNKQK